VAKAIKKEEYNPGEFPSIKDSVIGMDFIEKTVESHQNGNVWMKINE